jgi:hypothetical protein
MLTPTEDAIAAAGGLVGKAIEPIGAKAAVPSAKDEVRAAAHAVGYAFDPVEANPDLKNRLLGSFAGTANIKADFGLHNQKVTNQLGANIIGMPGMPLTQDTINQAWARANIPMTKLAAVSPEIEQTLQDVRQARYDAENAMYQYDTTTPGQSLKHNPALKQTANQLKEIADQKEQDLATLAHQEGVDDLYDDYVAGRVQQAKVGAVDEAFDPETNTLSAKTLAKFKDKGMPLTGDLDLIARTYKNFDDWMKDGPDIVRPGSNKINFVASAVMAKEGYDKFGVPGLALGLAPFIDAPTRAALGSRLGQQLLAQPSLKAIPTDQATLARLAAMYAGRLLASQPSQ